MQRRTFCRLALLAGLSAALPGLSGCGTQEQHSFTWLVDSLADNLDPQIARDSADLIACRHLFSSLTRLGPDGQPLPDAAADWTVSPDGLEYRFTLRPGQYYHTRKGESTDYPVTARDFVFAFRRLADPNTRSPYTALLDGVENAAAVVSGQLPPAALGVSAPDEATFRIRLEAPDDELPYRLSHVAAAPCCQAFFESTAGTYGLNSGAIIGNGPFYLYNWTSSGLFLRRSVEGSRITALRLIENSDTTGKSPATLLRDGRCSAILSGSAAPGQNTAVYQTGVWCLLLRCRGSLANRNLRAALTQVCAGLPLPGWDAEAAAGLVPPSIHCGSEGFRSRFPHALPPEEDPDQMFRQGLSEISAAELQGLTITVPRDETAQEFAGQLNAAWQKRFSIYCSIRTLSDRELAQTVAAGDFDAALVPLESTSDTPLSLLDQFRDGGLCGWHSGIFAQLMDSAAAQRGEALADTAAQAERLLLEGRAVLPLCWPRRYLLMEDRLQGLQFDPFGPQLDLTFASQK